MLNKQQTQTLKQRLLALQQALQNMLMASAESGETVELDQTRQDRLSRMDALQGQAMAQAAHARAAARLQSIGFALERLEEESFGDCVECGEPIPFDRLDIDPTARYCIACAEINEA